MGIPLSVLAASLSVADVWQTHGIAAREAAALAIGFVDARLDDMMNCLKLGNIALDGTKIAANASKHRALCWEHANRIEAHLREEVQTLLKLAEDSGTRPVNDGMDE